jgi:hypothetical protein
MDAPQERMESHHEEMMAIMKGCLGKMEVRMGTSQEKFGGHRFWKQIQKKKGCSIAAGSP